MLNAFSIRNLLLTTALVTVLAACDSAEEQAEEYFQSGIALMEEGDFDRAIVEFRNVFEFDGSHQEARRKLAEIFLLEKNNRRRAYQQYLRLAEQYPQDLDARINLSELAFEANNWEELERHGSQARELSTDENLRVEAIAIALDYRQAALDEDAATTRDKARAAAAILSELPENRVARGIVTDAQIRNGEIEEALVSLDWFLEREPENMTYWRQRLALLARTEDMAAVEEQLQRMIAQFPDNVENKQTLLRFYLSREEMDKAEAFLREQVTEEGNEGARSDLIRFLLEVRGPEAAREELAAAIAEEPDPVPYRIIRAGLDFDRGQRDAAINDLENILAQEGLSPDARRSALIALARFMNATGNAVGAQKHVEALLAEDPSNPEGLKMQAMWQIDADDPENAINSLRMALDRAPEDAQAMTLMAQAYNRTGRHELAQEFLSLAVEASGNAPGETIRYVNLLVREQSYLAAEDLLKKALRLAPQNVELLNSIGELYLLMDDDGRAQQVIRTLQQIDTQQSRGLAQRLEAERLNRQNGSEEAIAYLEELSQSGDGDVSAIIRLIQAQVSTGDFEAALTGAQELVAQDPQNPDFRNILAIVHQSAGNLSEAQQIFRGLVDENPTLGAVWMRLGQIANATEGPQAAVAVINEGLEATPNSPNLLWQSASLKEAAGDIDGAIAIYEALYEENSDSIIVANNLASLLATYRSDDAESVERAWTVARRLRDADIPALQDTYGWILHLRGENEEAVQYLESAAEGLANDPIVQYHLAQVYVALERTEEALAQYRKAIDVAGPADQRDQIVNARARVAEMQASTPSSSEGSQTQEN